MGNRTRLRSAMGAALVVCGFAGTAEAQVDLAVVSPAGQCDVTSGIQAPYRGNYIVPTGQEATFQCGLDSAQTPPSDISRVTVYVDVAHAERGDQAWARICYRTISESLSVTCGPTSYPSGPGDLDIAVEPPGSTPAGPVVAYLEVYIPSPAPGYHFFNGFRITAY